MGLGIISAWYLGMHFALREGFSYKTMTTAYGLAIVAALIGARVAHLITNPQTWQFGPGFIPALFTEKCEGLVAYGGYIGGALGAWVYFKIKKLDFWSMVDCTAASLVLGLGFTRIGCFLAGCCHGQPTDLPWCVIFPAGRQAAGVFPGEHAHSMCVHPTQIYESLVGFALVPVAIYLFKRRKFTGQAFLLLVPFYAVARFLLEIIRGDNDRGGFGNHAAPTLSTSQFIGIVLIFLVIIAYFIRRKTAPAPPEPLSKEEVNQRLLDEGVIKDKNKEKTAKSSESPSNTSPKSKAQKKKKKKRK